MPPRHPVRTRPKSDELAGAAPPRVVIEAIEPQVDCGRFAVKRAAGEQVNVRADVYADGHDLIRVMLRYRDREYTHATRVSEWREIEMRPLGNDRWEARFTVDRMAVYEFTVQGWVDRFASWRDGLSRKIAAGQRVDLELREGATMVRSIAERIRAAASPPRKRTARRPVKAASSAPAADLANDASPGRDTGRSTDVERLGEFLQAFESDDETTQYTAALSPELARLMERYDERRHATTWDPPLVVHGERERARTGAWYEMFPRSYSPEAGRSATFAEAAQRLPGIAEMGFDVVYLAPIHPIGTTFRKGRNNTLGSGPGDPGSPWAIGSSAGGHKAVEPGLGALEDFDAFVGAAERLGLEVALDLAYQVSPDHPYVREHAEWFRRRPDGSIQYAENPPKKYQDIYPFDFETATWPALWQELKSVVDFWIEHGVRIFRVDNPHTKPFRFWEWMIAAVHREHPDVIFLSEAFTRPKVMRYLAKLGFTQSYTYFTWRNSKAELIEYFTELTQTPVREYMRPNLFANTPDILHAYLQRGGPAAFRVRLLLAATLGASYGIYSGFEVCENRPLREGSEEYLHSEKYEYRHWDWNRPGNLRGLIARINAIRHEHPALQSDWGLRFHQTDNDQLICYSKQSSDASDALLVVANLDPDFMQHGWIRVPLAELGLTADGGYEAHDLLSGETYYWHGEWNYVRLEPQVQPGHILYLRNA